MRRDSDPNIPIPESGEPSAERRREWKPLFRGIWAEDLKDGDLLPVGGSMFSDELTSMLELDFAAFDHELSNIDPERMRALFEERRGAVTEWLEKVNPKEKIDPYLFFLCLNLQNKVEALLEVVGKDIDGFQRQLLYGKEKPPSLSGLRGKAMCAERAALGQYLLKKAGVESAYVGGAEMADAADREEYPSPHSFIVIPDPTDASVTYVFDIARPRSQNHLPRILKTDVPMTAELLAGKRELFVRAKEVLQGGELWFGVGEPVSGEHERLEVNET
ncbi:MAG TPA: hypothetical protein VL283_05245 [Candidatus Baltobacteraceae bacterium]|nr:hypothetical protein [Candidatus Baltobacteraceae bacterium]